MSSLPASRRDSSVGVLARLLTLLIAIGVPLALASSAATHTLRAAVPAARELVAPPFVPPAAGPSSVTSHTTDDPLQMDERRMTAASASTSTAALMASLSYNTLATSAMTPGATVTFTIRSASGGAVLGTGTRTADAFGFAGFYPPDQDVDLAPGMQVTASDGTTTKELILEPLAITALDVVNDGIGGTASPGAQVYVYAYTQGVASATRSVPADTRGAWRADFAGVYDLTGFSSAVAYVRDDDGDQTEVVKPPTILGASISSDYVHVSGFAVGATVSFTIRQSPGGSILATGGATADGSGSAYWYGSDHGIDLHPGLEISATDGVNAKSLTLAALSVTAVDTAADRVSGTAPAGAVVEVYVASEGSGSPTKTTTADAGGSWTIDFAGVFDITAVGTAYALVRDADGDATEVYKQPAFISAQLFSNSFWVAGFAPDAALTYTLRAAPGGSVLVTGTKTSDRYGSMWVGNVAHFAPGQHLTVTDGIATKDLTFADISITSIDPAAERVTGTAPPGADVEVSVSGPGSYSPTRHATVAADATWTVDFTGSYDIGYGTSAYAAVRDADGDATGVARQPATVTASLSWDVVTTSGFAPNVTATLTVRDAPDGAVVVSLTGTTTESGYVYFAAGIDLVPGMDVAVTDGTITKHLTLAALSVRSVDPTSDTVTGTAAPGTHVSVYAYDSSGGGSPTREVVADENGEWRADFAGAFHLSGVTAVASAADGDGDRTEASKRPSTIAVWLSAGSVAANGFAPNASATLTIRAVPGGAVLATAVRSTDAYGYAWFSRYDDFDIPLVAGQEVTVADGTTTRAMELAAISIDSVDIATDVVTGTAPAGATVDIDAYDGVDIIDNTAVANAAGIWRADFSGIRDIRYTTGFSAIVRDANGDTTGTNWWPPTLWVSLSDDMIQLNAFGLLEDVTLTVRSTRDGPVLWTGVVRTNAGGWALVDRSTHGTDLAAGMVVTATDETGRTKDLTLAPLAIGAVDADADTVTGSAPPGSTVEVVLPGAPPLSVTAGGDGTWRADFAGKVDIVNPMWAAAWVEDAEGDTTAVAWQPSLDTTPPAITTPSSPVVFDATSPSGTAVDYVVTVTDDVDPAPSFSCTPSAGASFVIGDTTVICTATDAAGNRAVARFVVHVRDAAEQLVRLHDAVVGVGPGTSLADHVGAAADALATGDRSTARAILNAFLNQVRALTGKSIAPATATQLTTDATRIRAVIAP